MTAHDRLEAGLARVSGRLQAERDQLRRAVETVPEFGAWLSAVTKTFGIKPHPDNYLEVGGLRRGRPEAVYEIDGRPGVVVRGPKPYRRPRGRYRGKAAEMRAREEAGR